MSRRVLFAPLLALSAACASGEGSAPALPPATEEISVLVLGDGFVRVDDRRLALEMFVLELRQRVRGMTAEERSGLRVNLDVDPEGGDTARDATERLMDELQIMGIWYGRYL